MVHSFSPRNCQYYSNIELIVRQRNGCWHACMVDNHINAPCIMDASRRCNTSCSVSYSSYLPALNS